MGDWDTNPSSSKATVQKLDNWVEAFDFETVLIYGKPKSGKTYCYMSMIDEELKKNPKTRFYLLCTDNGASKTFKSYFGDNKKILESIDYYPINCPTDCKTVIQKIRKEAKRTDFIIVDLISAVWDMAQDYFIAQATQAFGGNISDYVASAAKDPKKFGLLDSSKWLVIKRLDSAVTQDLLNNPFCNIIACAGEKSTDLEVIKIEAAIRKGKNIEMPEMLTLYEQIGAKPAGRKEMPYFFNTIIYIGGIQEKYFQMVGDRGNLAIGEPIKYGKNFWKTFQEKYRKKDRKSVV